MPMTTTDREDATHSESVETMGSAYQGILSRSTEHYPRRRVSKGGEPERHNYVLLGVCNTLALLGSKDQATSSIRNLQARLGYSLYLSTILRVETAWVH